MCRVSSTSSAYATCAERNASPRCPWSLLATVGKAEVADRRLVGMLRGDQWMLALGFIFCCVQACILGQLRQLYLYWHAAPLTHRRATNSGGTNTSHAACRRYKPLRCVGTAGRRQSAQVPNSVATRGHMSNYRHNCFWTPPPQSI